MGYYDALEAAGATVHEYQEFGSYQGTWIAKVTYKGKQGWIVASYGSCSGCDAYEATFGFDDIWPSPDDTPDDVAMKEQVHKIKLADFAQDYLDRLATQEETEAFLLKSAEYDGEAKDALAFIRKNAFVSPPPLSGY